MAKPQEGPVLASKETRPRAALGNLSTNQHRAAVAPVDPLRARAQVQPTQPRRRPRVPPVATARSVTGQVATRSKRVAAGPTDADAPTMAIPAGIDENEPADEYEDAMEDVEVAVPKPAELSYSERMLQMGVSDIDLADTSDPQAVTEYVVDIIQYMRDIERSFLPTSDYIMRHPDLTWHSRSLLNNWLVEVHWRFKFHPETLYLAINVLDRYMTLTPTPVTRSRLQAVGTGALIIASKYEETMVPSMSEFSSITQSNFSETELIRMERQMLYVLNFGLNYPSPMTFLRRISKAEEYDVPTRTVAKYLMEMTILHQNFLAYPPSMVAAASTLMARRVLNKGPWDNTMQFYSNYTEAELQPCIDHLTDFVQEIPTEFRAIYRKYSSSKFLRASLFVEQEVRRQGQRDR